jgi:hypothetical protein
MANKDELLAALDFYSMPKILASEDSKPSNESFFIFKDGKGYATPWTIERTCQAAAELIRRNDFKNLDMGVLPGIKL